jgi:hypothetical protein
LALVVVKNLCFALQGVGPRPDLNKSRFQSDPFQQAVNLAPQRLQGNDTLREHACAKVQSRKVGRPSGKSCYSGA